MCVYLEVMENRESSKAFLQFLTQRNHDDGDCIPENPDGFTGESRIQDIQEFERAVIHQQIERVPAVARAQTDAVLRRLELSTKDVTLPSHQPSAFSSRGTEFSQQGRRISPLLDIPRWNMEGINRNWRSLQSFDEEEHGSFWDKVLLGSQMAAIACEEAQIADRDESPAASIRPVSCCSPVGTHTPRELRDISLIGSPVEFATFKPTPPLQAAPLPRRRVSRLPVLSAKLSGADKKVIHGCQLQAAKNKVEAIVERLKCFISVHSSRPPAGAAKRTPAVATLATITLTVPQTKIRGSPSGTFLHPAQAVSGAGKKTASDGILQTANDRKVELQPLTNPVKSLSLCFRLLSSDNLVKKIDGLKTIQALARHHSETLKTRLHEVCLVLIEEVKSLCSAVACAAMNTLAEVYVRLQKAMDPEVEGTGRALLLKLPQTTNALIHQQANLALDAMVLHCSHDRILSVLLNKRLSSSCVAVRGSIAQHLHLLADSLGAARILTAGKSFTEHFLSAVSKMAVEAAPEVRHHGQIILQELALHKDFLSLWTKIVPEKERRSLDKILKKTRK